MGEGRPDHNQVVEGDVPYGARLEVHFYDETSAAANLELDPQSDAKSGEILLFTAFALRQATNLGPDRVAESVGLLLSQVPGSLRTLAHHDGPSGPRLIDYPDTDAKRRFIATLSGLDEAYTFDLQAKGFGFFAKGMRFYAPNSIFLVLRYLCLRRYDDDAHVSRLESAAKRCGDAIQDGQLTMTGQHALALQITRQAGRLARTTSGRKTRKRALQDDIGVHSIPRQASGKSEIVEEVGSKELAAFFLETADALPFASLDPATRIAFDRCVRSCAAVLAERCPEAVRSVTPVVLQEVGKGVFDGYAIGRRLLNTHRSRVHFSNEESQVATLSQRLGKEQAKIEPGRVLEIAGEPTQQFLSDLTDIYSKEGLFGAILDRGVAGSLYFVTMINGLALAYAEHDLSAEL